MSKITKRLGRAGPGLGCREAGEAKFTKGGQPKRGEYIMYHDTEIAHQCNQIFCCPGESLMQGKTTNLDKFVKTTSSSFT